MFHAGVIRTTSAFIIPTDWDYVEPVNKGIQLPENRGLKKNPEIEAKLYVF